MSLSSWHPNCLRQWCGRACFAAVFRRPVLSVLQQIFHVVNQALVATVVPDDEDSAQLGAQEMAVFTALLPLMFTNLRSPLDGRISCSDASENGGGSATAVKFATVLDPVTADENKCANCNRYASDFSAHRDRDGQNVLPCLWCSRTLCTWQCAVTHYSSSCSGAGMGLPVWREYSFQW
eukprot:6470612-Amphidinium_carterae.1